MKYIGGLLGGIATLLIPFVIFYLESEKPDVVYSLSENIPVSDTDNKENSIQQIKVTNIGEVEAKDISIKLNREVINYRIINNSKSDKVEIFKEGPIEILYHQLPPDGTFSVILETNNIFLTGNDISIMSSVGKARNALEVEDNYLSTIIFVIVVVIYITFFLTQLRRGMVDSKHRRYSRNSSIAGFDFLDTKKPIYFTKNEWEYLVETFVKNKLVESYYGSFKELYDDESLMFLKLTDVPQNMSAELFNNLKKDAKRTFQSKLDTLLPSYSYVSYEKIDIIAQKVYEKINSLPSYKEGLIERLSANYIKLLINKGITNTEELDRKMKKERPIFVIERDWGEYKRHLEDVQFLLVVKEIRYTTDKKSFLPLLQSDQLLIREFIYSILLMDKVNETFLSFQKPLVFNDEDWLKATDSRTLEKTVESINRAEDNEEAASLKLKAIKDIIVYNEFTEDKYVDVFKENELELLKKYEATYKHMQQEIEELSSRERDLRDKEFKTSNLMEKITCQLKIINDLFDDPRSIDRLEDYQVPFAQGNFERLKELSALISIEVK
ncbi:hypothetical protein ACM1TL_14375 [Lysinibacillus capsici]|uniref:hypothetical protein n=1 Tax=Lysinibacillus capsici TaxID=2115968 RepID=UPI0039FD91BA